MTVRAAGTRRALPAHFRVGPGRKVSLSKWPTRIPKLYAGEADARLKLARQVARTSELQEVFYADGHRSLLLVFQAMDAAGKDGTIKNVLSGVNPQGCQVWSFKQPSTEELGHDFLWRVSKRLPRHGHIGVFNRSHYEEVLVVRVHPELLAAQRLPEPRGGAKAFWDQRLRSIRDYEAHLHRNGTLVVKFFLHVSKDEQRERFLERISEPDKNWKFNLGDVEERQYWDDYMRAYEQAIGKTSTRDSPWYIVPADDKRNARLIVSQIVNATLEGLGCRYPQSDRKRLNELQAARRLL